MTHPRDTATHRDATSTPTLPAIFESAVRHYQRLYPDLRVAGPEQTKPGGIMADRTVAFADSYASAHAPYLRDDFHRSLDSYLERFTPAACFTACLGSKVLGSLRVRLEPHEYAYVAPELGVVREKVREFAEYSRLMISPCHRSLGIGRLLMAEASLWVTREWTAKGIVALCRRETGRVFRQFGLLPLYPEVILPRRNSASYVLMLGSWPAIGLHLVTHPPRESALSP